MRPNALMLTEVLGDNWNQLAAALPQQSKSPKPAQGSRIALHPGSQAYYLVRP
jgi:hypothetical protein